MKVMETERLILRQFKPTDLDDFFEYCSMETVGPNAGWLPHESKEESFETLKSFSLRDDIYALEYKENNKVIGSIGIHKKIKNDKEYYELGYVLSTLYEGKGLMTEAVKKALHYFFIDLDKQEIFVSHFINNKKSERVVVKSGFKFINNIDYETANYGILKSKYYILTKKEYIKQMEGNNETMES